MAKCKVCGYKKHPVDGSCACGMVVLDPEEVLRGIRERPRPMSDEPSDDGPVCTECLEPFCWNEFADRDDPEPLCDSCAYALASAFQSTRGSLEANEAGRATLQRELEVASGLAMTLEADLVEARARIAALESGQANAAVEALREAAMRLPSEFRSVEADRLTSAANWLESRQPTPQPTEPCRGAQTATMRAEKAKC